MVLKDLVKVVCSKKVFIGDGYLKPVTLNLMSLNKETFGIKVAFHDYAKLQREYFFLNVRPNLWDK